MFYKPNFEANGKLWNRVRGEKAKRPYNNLGKRASGKKERAGVKEFASLANLKVALGNEGFSDIVIKYMGELWVMLEFKFEKALLKFQESTSVMSWFSQVVKVTPEFEVEGRIAWVEVEGIPFKLWTRNTFARVAEKWGKLLDVDDEEETCYHSKRLCIHMKSGKSINEDFKIIHRGKMFWIRAIETPGWAPDFTDEIDNDDINSTDDEDVVQKSEDIEENSDSEKVPDTIIEDEELVNKCDDEMNSVKNLEKSEDPFNIYSLLNRKDSLNKKEKDSESSLSHPPGYTPPATKCDDARSENIAENQDTFSESCANNNLEENNGDVANNCFDNVKIFGDSKSTSVCSGSFKKSIASGGSFLNVMEEIVNVGQTMGFNMDGCEANMAEIIKSQGASMNKVNFLALQETKMETMDLSCVKCCWGNYAFEFSHSNSVGNSGGILCVWDPVSFQKTSHTISDSFVILRGVWLKNGSNLLVVVVYGPHDHRDKRQLWDYLGHSIKSWKGEVVVMGDFNEVRHRSDRFGSVFNVQGADDFNSFITTAGLVEVPLGGSTFTWCHKSASKMSKLDRFFTSENMLIKCPNISAISLDRFISDHRPILLREMSYDYGPTSFRFFHHWLELDGFKSFVTGQWNLAPVDSANGMRNLMGKLKFIKASIKDWLKCNTQCNRSLKDKYKEDLRLIDVDIDSGKGSDILVAKRIEILNDLQNIEKIHAMDLAQKAKIKWSIEGDENSRFFHGILNKKRHQMNIRGVMVDGSWQENPNAVKREFYNHFRNRFDKPPDQRATIDMTFPNSLSPEQQSDLECDVTAQELKQAVWDCGLEKSPGPDGFSFGFYRQFWDTIEKDVFKAINHFFTNVDIPKGCNSSFIALIPKIPDANLVKDFRPISLIGSIYKIIAKILTNRLVKVIGDIVSDVQSAFIKGRQILDGPFILNEVIQWCKRKKKHALIFKVDFEKAFDSVRWDFLDDILRKFGFGNKWCEWIQKCLVSSRGSILINGSPTEEFQFFKGLKQGDPLSPFLFILVMECLHISFQKVVDAGKFTGINLNQSTNLSHMFYADDAVFVGQWNDRNINTIIYVLSCFFYAPGLRINMSKSRIMGIHVNRNIVHQAAGKLGCLTLNTPFSYLGTKVGGNMSRTEAWNEVIDKVRSRLSKWKMNTLSIGGRLTLLKSVLGSIPIFHMSIFRVPLGVLQKLESIRRNFFNGHEYDSRKASIYFLLDIHLKEVKELRKIGVNVSEWIRLKLGNGESTSFWYDNWSGSGAAKDTFPRLFALENHKEISVRSKLDDSSLDSSFRRTARGGIEQVQFDAL
ncbi:RNA-directed DNA polymerase, eukaryota [Tanacetum coccineum]